MLYMYISTDFDFAAKIQKQTRPRFTRLTLIADIGPWEAYSGLPLQHTDRTLDITHPVVLSFLDTEVVRSTPVAQSVPRNLLTRWDVSSIPANGIFLTKN